MQLILLAVLAGLPAGTPPGRGGPTLTAEAGLGGLVKPGRWAAVRVVAESRTEEIAGEVVVTWGRAEVRRALWLPAPARKTFELHLRNADVRDALVVRLEVAGRRIRSVEVPVRVVPEDQPVTVCVAGVEAGPQDGECSVTLRPEALPRSWRGYDAATHAVVPASGLAPEQAQALEHFVALRQPAVAEAMGIAPPPSLGRTESDGGIRAAWLAYPVALLGFGRRLRRRHAGLPVLALLSLIAACSAAALLAGRLGQSARVRVRASSVVTQLPGQAVAFVRMRGVVRYPAFDDYALHVDAPDAVVETRASSEVARRLDEEGRALLVGSFGSGATEAFELEGLREVRILDASPGARGTRITNRSDAVLDACRFVRGFDSRSVGLLRPGGSIESEPGEQLLACRLRGAPVRLTDPRHEVECDGESVVIHPLAASGPA